MPHFSMCVIFKDLPTIINSSDISCASLLLFRRAFGVFYVGVGAHRPLVGVTKTVAIGYRLPPCGIPPTFLPSQRSIFITFHRLIDAITSYSFGVGVETKIRCRCAAIDSALG
eukprot:scaffold13822_cov106-Skeletonema_marinoi.AAC.2